MDRHRRLLARRGRLRAAGWCAAASIARAERRNPRAGGPVERGAAGEQCRHRPRAQASPCRRAGRSDPRQGLEEAARRALRDGGRARPGLAQPPRRPARRRPPRHRRLSLAAPGPSLPGTAPGGCRDGGALGGRARVRGHRGRDPRALRRPRGGALAGPEGSARSGSGAGRGTAQRGGVHVRRHPAQQGGALGRSPDG